MSKSPHVRPCAAQLVSWQQTLLWQTPEHEPQFWLIPQPISRLPQFLPCAAQLVGVQTPHTFAVPPPPHVSPAPEHVSPQSCVIPQPMLIVPQFSPSAAQLVGVQTAHTFAVPPPPHVSPAPEHVSPQSCVIPQPMLIVPQFLPSAAQLVGVHTPHTFAVPPPPHVSTAPASPVLASVPGHVPHFCVIPQPMLIVPQFLPSAAQLFGVHTPHTFAVPPPPQLAGVVQLPHWSVAPHPSEMAPQSLPSSAHVFGTHPLHAWSMHVAPAGHEPQAIFWPVHASLTVPQVAPSVWQALGSGAGTHALATHCCPPVQVPHIKVPPHPSEMVPQSLPAAAHVVVWHVVHVWLTASQACPEPQLFGQDIGLPQPSMIDPHWPVQSPATHAVHLCVAPSQTWPAAHVPQTVRLPQASPRTPHVAPMAPHASVTHSCLFGSHVDFAVASHVPHASAPAQVESGPQPTPADWQVAGTQPASAVDASDVSASDASFPPPASSGPETTSLPDRASRLRPESVPALSPVGSDPQAAEPMRATARSRLVPPAKPRRARNT